MTCLVPCCDKPAKRRGYCPGHTVQWRRHGPVANRPLRQRNAEARLCKVSDCTEVSHSQGLCNKHATQQRLHKKLSPAIDLSEVTRWTKADSDALDLVILVMRGYSVAQAAEQLGMKPNNARQLLRHRSVDLASLKAPVPWMPRISLPAGQRADAVGVRQLTE